MIKQFPSFKTTSYKKFLFLVFSFTLSFFCNSKDIYVNDASTTGDIWCTAAGSASGLGIKVSPYASLRTALTNAVSGDVIYIDAGNYSEKSLLAKSGVSVIGAGAYKTKFSSSGSVGLWFMKIDGITNFSISNIITSGYLNNDASMGQNFTILNSSNIKISNVTLSKNNGSNGDAAIYLGSNSSNIILDGISGSCQNNSNSGTAIVLSGNNISAFIKNSLFTGNDNTSQGSNGSALRIISDATTTPNVNVNIENCIYSKNISKKGGAIYIEGGSVSINKCKFLGNKTTNTIGSDGGGAIWVAKTSSLCTISNSEFKYNQAAADGGAIQVYTGFGTADVKIENCLFENNSANNGKDIHTRMKAGKPFNVTVNNCIFKSSGTNIVSGPSLSAPCEDGVLKVNNSGMPSTLGLNSYNDLTCKSTINIDNLPSGYTDPGITFPTYQETCPNAAICNPAVPSAAATVTCPATTANLTVTGPANSTFDWYDVASGGTALGKTSNISPASTDFTTPTISASKIFYVVSSLDNCQTRVPITVNYDCPSCASTITYAGSPFCQKDKVSPILTPTSSGSFIYSCTSSDAPNAKTDLIINSSTGEIDLANSKPGKYTIQCEVSASCKPTTEIIIKPKPATPTLGTPVDPTCALDGSVVISGLPVVALPKQWTLKSNAKYNFSTTGNTATYNYTSLKSNNKIQFIVELDGCLSDSTTELTVANAPGKPFIEGPSTVCVGSEIALKAWTDNTKTTKSTPSATSPWSLKDTRDGDTVSLTTGTDPSVTSSIIKGLKSASSTKPAEVVLIYTDNNGCISDYFISVNSIPSLTYMNEARGVCIGSQMELKASIPGGVWTCLSPQFADLSSNYLYPKSGVTGLNVVELKYQLDQKNCNASITEFVKIFPLPQIEGPSSICVGDTTTLKDIANRAPLTEKTIWSLTNDEVVRIEQNGLLKAIKPGVTEVIGQNVFGCDSRKVITIRPAALFDDTTIHVCSGVETSLIPIIKNASSTLNPTFKWSVTNNTIVDGENEMLSLVPAFKQTLINKSGSDQTVNYLLSSNVGTGTDACLTTRKLNVVVNSELVIVGLVNIDLSKQIQYTTGNNSGDLMTWSTSNPQVITVNPSGLVSPKGVGSAILSVTNQFGCTAQMNINVSDNQKISGLNVVCEGSQLALKGFGTPKAVDPWTSANTSILTINANGQVTGIKAGKSLVSYFNDQGQKDTMTVFVKTTPVVDLIQDYNICPGYFADGIKFNGTPGASFEWKNNNIAIGLLPEGIQQISPFDAINNGSTNFISEISVTPRLGECLGASKKFNITVRFIPRLKITQLDTVVCPGGNINFKTELTPAVTSPIYQWTVNGAKVGVNSSIYWSNTLKSNDKITVNLSGKDFCPTSADLFVRMDSLRLSMQVPSMLYLKDPAINLVGYPVGGTFSGKGIINNKLDPSVAGVGNKIVTYSFKNANNCIGTISQKVVIYDTVFNNCHLTTYDTVTVTDTVSILKIKFKLTTGIKANQETTMRVYPNPTSDILVIEATDEKALAGYRYKIRDVAGKEVYNQPVKVAFTQISLKSLGAAGTYFFEVYDEKLERQVTKKIILD